MLYYHHLNKTLPSDEQTKLVVVPDCKDIVINKPEPLYKFLIISDESQDLLNIIEHLSELDGLTVTQSMPMLCDVMKTGITKAYALQRLSESLGIKREEIAAIGDQHNDIDLIDDFVLNDMINTADIASKAA
jgi:hypothetical protein